MTSLTRDDKAAAIDRQLIAWRAQLADLTLAVQLHRDVLNSPRDQVKGLEDQAALAAKAIQWLEGQRAAE